MEIALLFGYLKIVFLKWIGLFAAPVHNFELLWIIIPVYLNWLFTEFYQEKKGTSLGNAISNGFVPLWVGIDWSKTTYMMLKNGVIALNSLFVAKMAFAFFMIAYGGVIVILGIRVKKVAHYLGKIRVVTYISLMLTPVFYGTVPVDWLDILSIVIFFPLFYFVIELFDTRLPTPKTYDEDEMPSSGRIPSVEMQAYQTRPPQTAMTQNRTVDGNWAQQPGAAPPQTFNPLNPPRRM